MEAGAPPPRASKTPAQSAPARTLAPKTRTRAEHAFGRAPGEVAKDGGGVMKMAAKYLLSMVERLGKVGRARQVPEIPTGAPDPPPMTQWVGGGEGFRCHECL